MKPLFICYPRCSTCQKALNGCRSAGSKSKCAISCSRIPPKRSSKSGSIAAVLRSIDFSIPAVCVIRRSNLKEKVRTAPRERADPRAFDRRYVGETAFADRFRQDFGRIPRAGVAAALSEKDRRFRLYRNRKRTEISVRRGYFFILSGCRSRLILFLRRTDQPK